MAIGTAKLSPEASHGLVDFDVLIGYTLGLLEQQLTDDVRALVL